jgi:hypothetical protein
MSAIPAILQLAPQIAANEETGSKAKIRRPEMKVRKYTLMLL